MTTPPTPGIPPEHMAEFIQAMHDMRDALLKASLLQDHLYEIDQARPGQARPWKTRFGGRSLTKAVAPTTHRHP